jgi:ABC-type Zn uptake system ZnuABC Zn-binding protein ZnuA
MRKLFWVLGIFLMAGCTKQGSEAGAPAGSPPPKKLLVLATTAPMYCFTKNVAGDLADVEMIVPEGANPRGFVPTDDEVQKIMSADMVVENGFGFEDWMDKLEARGLSKGEVRVIAAKGTGPGIPGLPGDPNTEPAGPPDMDAAGPPDPHVWLDPMMAIKEVQNIRDALMARDPVRANGYLSNENRYEAALRDLDDSVGRITLNITKRRLYCPDTTFTYFLSRYEFPVVAKAENASGVLISTGQDALMWKAKGVPVVTADPMEAGPAATDYYETKMMANAMALQQGLMQ